jgi:hypothetical protein
MPDLLLATDPASAQVFMLGSFINIINFNWGHAAA